MKIMIMKNTKQLINSINKDLNIIKIIKMIIKIQFKVKIKVIHQELW